MNEYNTSKCIYHIRSTIYNLANLYFVLTRVPSLSNSRVKGALLTYCWNDQTKVTMQMMENTNVKI